MAWQLWSNSSFAKVLRTFTQIFVLFSVLSAGFQFITQSLSWGTFSTSLMLIGGSAFIARFIDGKFKKKVLFLFSTTVIQTLFLGASFFTLPPIEIKEEVSIPEYLVQVEHESRSEFIAFATSQDRIEIKGQFNPIDKNETVLDDYFVVDVLGSNPKKIGAVLENLPYVKYIENNEEVYTPAFESPLSAENSEQFIFEDPLNNQQWSLINTEMKQFYEVAKNIESKKTVKLFILDTGVDGKHEDLKEVFKSNGRLNDRDKRGHGTHCAGIAAAVTGNNIGISSFNFDGRIEIYSEKVLSDFGGGTQDGIINGMIRAVDKGADVISMSLGGRSSDSKQKAYNAAVKYANRRGCIVVVAAGNSKDKATKYSPANSKGVITVAASDFQNELASFSNTLEGIKYGVYAPGVNILSTYPDNKYESLSGTSMATPFVAGLVALMKSIKPELQTEEAHDILNASIQENSGVPIVKPKTALEKLIEKN